MIYLKLSNKNLTLKALIKKEIYIIDWIKFKLDITFITNKLSYHKQNIYKRFLYMVSHADKDYLYKLKNKYDKSDIDFNNYFL